MSRPTPPTYKTRNWPRYTEALNRRGSLTIRWLAGDCLQSPQGWIDPAMTWEAAPTGKRGRQPEYSAAAIQTCPTVEVLFGMALRQTTGFVESLLGLIGLDRAVPDFSTLSCRQKSLKVNIPYRSSDTRKCHDAIVARGAAAIIPPGKNAKPWKPDTAGAIAGNDILRTSGRLGRTIWRRWSGDHRRSRAETKMHCVKLLGQRLMARDFDRQVAEFQVRVAVLNGYTALGIPVTRVAG